jgi:putative cell wall-binding protein
VRARSIFGAVVALTLAITMIAPGAQPAYAATADRLAGADRFATSAAISADAFDPGVPVAYVANGLNFPDALSGAPAAAALGGPVLLTLPDAVPAPIEAELRRLQPARVVVLGSAASVSEAVKTKLASITKVTVARQAGPDRFATSAATSAAAFPQPGVPVAYVASGLNFPDALSGAPAAGALGGPVLLTLPDGVPAPIEAELRRLKPARVVVLGSAASVADATAAKLADITKVAVTRQAGADRFATSAAISSGAFEPGVPVAYVANGLNFPDALSGAPAAGAAGGPVLLSLPDKLPALIEAELRRLKPARIVVLGSGTSIADSVQRTLGGLVKPPQGELNFTAVPTPTVSGTAKVGERLTAQAGTWLPTPDALTYQWRRDNEPIPGATKTTYTLTSADAGHQISIAVTAAKAGYFTSTMTSLEITVEPAAVPEFPDVRVAPARITKDTTWSGGPDTVYLMTETVEIAQGATLTIAAGTLIRAVDFSNGGFTVHGAIRVAGTAAAPVVIEPVRDEADLRVRTLADQWRLGFWSGMYVESHGSVDVAHLDVRGTSGNGIAASDAAARYRVVDSNITGTLHVRRCYCSVTPELDPEAAKVEIARNTLRGGVVIAQSFVTQAVEPMTVMHNTVHDAYGRYPFLVWDQSGIEPTLIAGNRSLDAEFDVLSLSGPIRSSWTIPASGPQIVFEGPLIVPEGVHVKVAAGAVVKFFGRIDLCQDCAYVQVDGALTTSGTTASPVTFTSALDDSVGKVTRRGWETTEPAADDWEGIIWGSGSVSLTRTSVRFNRSLSLAAPTTLRNVTADGDVFVGRDATEHPLSITDSTFPTGSLYVGSQTTSLTAPPVTLTGNRVAGDLGIDDRAMRPSKLAGTVVTGPGSRIMLSGRIVEDWTLRATDPVYTFASALELHSTVTVQAGTTVRMDGSSTWGIEVHGKLLVEGTAAKPVVFTSERDGAEGDLEWWGIWPQHGSTFTARHLQIRHAVKGVYLGFGGASVNLDDTHFSDISEACIELSEVAGGSHFRGSVRDCPIGVETHGILPFDATGVDWGTAAGPFGDGAPTAEGNVDVVPWAGYVKPAQPVIPVRDPGWHTCATTAVLAVRGSGEVPKGPTEVAVDRQYYDFPTYLEMTAGAGLETRGLGNMLPKILTGQRVTEPGKVVDEAAGLLDQLPAALRADTRIVPIEYPAADTGLLFDAAKKVDVTKLQQYLLSVEWGVGELQRRIEHEVALCPDQELVITGYSQGAMAAHMALAELAADGGHPALDRISAVLLLADPLQDAAEGEYQLSGSGAGATSWLEEIMENGAARSLWRYLAGSSDAALEATYPWELTDRTYAYCTAFDVMCAPSGTDFSRMVAAHTGYTTAQLAAFGGAARETVEARSGG